MFFVYLDCLGGCLFCIVCVYLDCLDGVVLFCIPKAAPPKIPSECETNQVTMQRIQQPNKLLLFTLEIIGNNHPTNQPCHLLQQTYLLLQLQKKSPKKPKDQIANLQTNQPCDRPLKTLKKLLLRSPIMILAKGSIPPKNMDILNASAPTPFNGTNFHPFLTHFFLPQLNLTLGFYTWPQSEKHL